MKILKKEERVIVGIIRRTNSDYNREEFGFMLDVKDVLLTGRGITRSNFAGLQTLLNFEGDYDKFMGLSDPIRFAEPITCYTVYSDNLLVGLEKDGITVDLESGVRYSVDEYFIARKNAKQNRIMEEIDYHQRKIKELCLMYGEVNSSKE